MPRAQVGPTPLQQQLVAGGTGQHPGALDAFRLARERFLAAERVDMSALAEELGVNRVTLYRWVGSRDQLLVEVVWSLARGTLDAIDRRVRDVGAERVVQIVTQFLDAVIADAGMRRWLGEEGETALRLLTRRDTDFQPRLIEAVHDVLAQEAVQGALELPADLDEIAYAIVRLIESYTYLDLITGERSEAQRAEGILRLLLR